jgi:pimeloyl-ACP methyl ester carboxylesterase
MGVFERGTVRIHFEEQGSGFPLLVIPGGGLNSTILNLKESSPFNPMEELKAEYRCIAADLRNANAGQSSGPLEAERPWDAYTDDHLGLMDHLGIDKFLVLGFCIGGPMIWNLLKRAPDRIVAAVLAQPSGSRPELRDLFYENNMKGWGPALVARRGDRSRLRVHRDARLRAELPDAGPDPARRYSGAPLCGRHGSRDARTEGGSEHVSVERTEGADSARGAPDPFVLARASRGLAREGF